MKYLVWINGEEHDDFMSKLGKQGFKWQGGDIAGSGECVYERLFDRNYATVYSLDFEKKEVTYFVVMEIYAPNSPMRDGKKYNEYLEQCKSCEWILNELKEQKYV